MSLQVTIAAGRTEAGNRQVSLSIGTGRRSRDETRTPKPERGTRERRAKTPGRQRQSLGRRMWRAVRRSRGMAVARVAGGLARDGLAMTPLGRLTAQVAAPFVQGGRNIQRRWTDVRARQQGLGRPARTPQQQQIINLKGQVTRARKQIAALQAQLGQAQQSPSQSKASPAPAGKRTAPQKKTGPQKTGPQKNNAKAETTKAQRGGKPNPGTTKKGRESNRAGGQGKALQSRNGSRTNTTAKASQPKVQRTTTRGGR
jgi:hypothetical protein